MTSSVASGSSEPNIKSPSLFLKAGLGVLAVSLSVLGYTYYDTKIKPLSGYGDDWAALDYLKEKDPKALSGGDLTHFMFGDVSFVSEAQNLPWQMQATFDDGDGVFERPFSKKIKKWNKNKKYIINLCKTKNWKQKKNIWKNKKKNQQIVSQTNHKIKTQKKIKRKYTWIKENKEINMNKKSIKI